MLKVTTYIRGDVFKQKWTYPTPKNKDKYFRVSRSYCYWSDDNLIAIMSYLPIGDKAIVTLLPSPEILKHIISLTKHVRAGIETHSAFFRTKMLLTQAPTSDEKYHKWLTFLGFEKITESRKYIKRIGG